MNTFFKHQASHVYTWYRYNNQLGDYDQKTQIDFILSTKKSIIKDVKAIPSESLDSDHRLLMGKLKIHLPSKAKTQTRKRLKVENLSENKQEIQETNQMISKVTMLRNTGKISIIICKIYRKI